MRPTPSPLVRALMALVIIVTMIANTLFALDLSSTALVRPHDLPDLLVHANLFLVSAVVVLLITGNAVQSGPFAVLSNAPTPRPVHPVLLLASRTSTTFFWAVLSVAALVPDVLTHPGFQPVLGVHLVSTIATLLGSLAPRRTA